MQNGSKAKARYFLQVLRKIFTKSKEIKACLVLFSVIGVV